LARVQHSPGIKDLSVFGCSGAFANARESQDSEKGQVAGATIARETG